MPIGWYYFVEVQRHSKLMSSREIERLNLMPTSTISIESLWPALTIRIYLYCARQTILFLMLI